MGPAQAATYATQIKGCPNLLSLPVATGDFFKYTEITTICERGREGERERGREGERERGREGERERGREGEVM
jgi:hypothetical protein